MASAYSQDLRDRVIDAVIRGGMSGRAAVARFGVSESSAIKWVQRFERNGSRAGEQNRRIPPSKTRAASRISRSAETREIRHHA
jgi:transposase